jgi:arylsulfatase
MKNTFTTLTFLVLLLCTFTACTEKKEKLPNVVIIFTDDQGYADVGSYGAVGFETPHLDKMAGEGMRFTSFYASQAVCSASRASLLTGCYSERVSIAGALGPTAKIGLNPKEETIADLLKKKDYATGIFGKWHLGHDTTFLPLQQGFDEYLGLPYSNDMWPVDYDGKSSKRKKGYPLLPLIDGDQKIMEIKDLVDQATLTTRYTERAVDFIKKNKDNPFFLYLPHSMPHVPLAVSDKFKGKSEQGMYGDVIMEIDWSVGQVMQALKEAGVEDNTLVIFTSDNGPWMNFGNHAGSALPLREGKGTMWEGGPRVPCIMKWPGKIEPATITDKMASTIDILPTLASVLDIPLGGNKLDGVDISSLMYNDIEVTPRETFYFYYGKQLRAVRNGPWKLYFPHQYRTYKGVEPGKDGMPGPYGTAECGLELYNLTDDISETQDVADQYPDIVEHLQKLAEQARYELGDALTKVKGKEVRDPGRLGPKRDTNVKHRAVNKTVNLISIPHENYSGDGGKTLTNGKLGSFDFKDGEWLGYWGDNFEAVLDLGEVTDVKKVKASFLQEQNSWIFMPEEVSISVSSDGKIYNTLPILKNKLDADYEVLSKNFEIAVNEKVRFIKVMAKNIGVCPDWHQGEGGQAWVFVDEIIVE